MLQELTTLYEFKEPTEFPSVRKILFIIFHQSNKGHFIWWHISLICYLLWGKSSSWDVWFVDIQFEVMKQKVNPDTHGEPNKLLAIFYLDPVDSWDAPTLMVNIEWFEWEEEASFKIAVSQLGSSNNDKDSYHFREAFNGQLDSC